MKPRGASLQLIPGTKVLAWDQAGSDQAPNWGEKGEKKIGVSGKKKAKEGSRQLGLLFFHFTQFLPFSRNAELAPRPL